MSTSAETLRESIQSILRNMGYLENNKALCCAYTYMQCHTLVEVGKNTNLSINDLATKLNFDKSAVSRTVEELVKKELLKREQDSNDRRYVRISLTTQGLKIMDDIEANSRTVFEKILLHLPPTKMHIAVEGVHLFNEALRLYSEKCISNKNVKN